MDKIINAGGAEVRMVFDAECVEQGIQRECLRLSIIHSPSTKTFYVISTDSNPPGLLVSGNTLTEALAAVPRALRDLRAVGIVMPRLDEVPL